MIANLFQQYLTIKYGKTIEILWFRTYVAGSSPMVAIKFSYKSGNNVLDFE